MLDSILKAVREMAGRSALVAPVGNIGRTLTYRWRAKLDGVWHPESEEPPLLGAEAVASAMGLPEPATLGFRIVSALVCRKPGTISRADYDRYSAQFEVEKVTVAADDDVDLEGDAALLRRCVDAGIAAAMAYRRRAPRERSGQGGRSSRTPRPPAGGRGRGPGRRALYRAIPWGSPAPAPAAPAPGPAAPAPPPPPPPPANSSSDDSSSSSDDDFNPNGADTSDSEPECG